MSKEKWISGSWNVICDRCGFKFKNDELRDEWTGFKVCKECWEPRHPQDLLRSKPEKISVPWTRPEPADVSVGPTYQNVGNLENTIPSGTFNTTDTIGS